MVLRPLRGDALGELQGLLELGNKSGNASDQKRVYEAISAAERTLGADLPRYFAALLCSEGIEGAGGANRVSEDVAMTAGLMLKNTVRAGFSGFPVEVQDDIKGSLVQCLTKSRSARLKQTGAASIAAIAVAVGLETWPELVLQLQDRLRAGDMAALETVHEILEDCKLQEESGTRPEKLCLDVEVPGLQQTPSALIIPILLQVAQSSPLDFAVGKICVKCLNTIAGYMTPTFFKEMPAYATALFTRATDNDVEVRMAVCQGIVALLSLYSPVLEGHWEQVVNYMLNTTRATEHPELAREGCEFWPAYCETGLPSHILKGSIAELIPVLLTNMVYAEDDEEVFDVEEEEQLVRSGNTVKDRVEELKPFLGKSKTKGHGGDEGEDEDELVSAWNLRKCSAMALDSLSEVFEDELLPHILPTVQQRLSSTNWRMREAATLSLGAVANGCFNGMRGNAATLVQCMIPQLSDDHPMVRSIACWSLSRYTRLFGEIAAETGNLDYLNAIIGGILKCMADMNRKVQEGSCGAIATLLENNDLDQVCAAVSHNMGNVAHAIAHGLRTYGKRTLPSLTELVDTLAGYFGLELADPGVSNVVMGAFSWRWNQTPDNDVSLLPLMESTCALLPCLGSGAMEFSDLLCLRAVKICREQLGQRNASGGECERNFVMLSLDVVSGVAESIGEALSPLVANTEIVEICVAWCEDKDPDVRQSAFALIGDLCKATPSLVQKLLPRCLDLAVQLLHPQHLIPENIGASNNVCWAAGELALVSTKESVEPYAIPLAEKFVPIFSMKEVAKSLFENAAISLGRVALACPGPIAPHLGQFMAPWCYALCKIRDDVEKQQAFFGLCQMLRLNPEPLKAAIVPFCCGLASWKEVKNPQLKQEMQYILRGYRAAVPNEQWEMVLKALGAYLERILILLDEKQ